MTEPQRGRLTERGTLLGRWTVVAEASECRFAVRDKLVGTARGTMPVVGGGAELTDGIDVTWIEVSVAGIETGNSHRDRDLQSPRFLDAASHPTVRVEVGGAYETPAGWTARATVSARGAHAPVDLLVEAVASSDAQIRVHVTGRLDRTPLGIKAPTFIVGRFVDLDADVTFRKED